MRIFIFAIGSMILAFFAQDAWSHDHHSTKTVIQNTDSTALAIAASQIHMDWSTTKLQGSVGTGSYNGSHALSAGLGKKVGKVLVNGSIVTDGTNTGFGAGINWRF